MIKEELEFAPFDDVRHAKAMDELVEYVQGGRSEAEAKADLFDEIVNHWMSGEQVADFIKWEVVKVLDAEKDLYEDFDEEE
jgi:hypothetical protein